jgi:small-conductance mechanosensitive channel
MSLQPQPNTNNTNHKQTPSPATLRNPYVKSDTIQSSFQSLTTETDQYRQATQEATTERHALQERLQACRQEIQTRADEIRAAQDTLGGATREISLWRRQEANLRDKVLRERQILEELTHTIQTLEGTVKNDRYDFCRTMAELNHELGRHLRAHEETRLTSFLHPATADGVLMTHENSGEEEGGDATNNPHNNHGPDDSPARDEHRAIQAALVALHEAAGVYQDVSAQQENCSQRIDALRRRILAEGKRTATAAAASRDKSVADEDEVSVGWWGRAPSSTCVCVCVCVCVRLVVLFLTHRVY